MKYKDLAREFILKKGTEIAPTPEDGLQLSVKKKFAEGQFEKFRRHFDEQTDMLKKKWKLEEA